ncbi:hypothetical protein T484DRAFT_1837849, partial [Baffinella frigidus]
AKKEARGGAKKAKKAKNSDSESESEKEEEEVEEASGPPAMTEEQEQIQMLEARRKTVAFDDDDIEAGPDLPASSNAVVGERTEASYGGALRPGEGTAMASYVQ